MSAFTSYRLFRKSVLFLLYRTQKCKTKTNLINYKKYSTQYDSAGVTNISIKLSNGKETSISSGKFARLADGCAVVKSGDTSVMVTAVSKVQPSNNNFLPLIVDYRMKAAAAGRIPINFLRRDHRTSETEILISRLIDRSLRPLFPEGYCHETQIMCNMLAIDSINDPDVISINAASAALALSDIPWNGPVGAVRVGLIGDDYILHPTRRELQQSSLNMIITATSDNLVVMMEGLADNIADANLKKAIKIGTKECQHIIHGIHNLQKQYGKPKRMFTLNPTNPEVLETIRCLSEVKLQEIFMNHNLDKIQRDNAISALKTEVIDKVKVNFSDLDMGSANETFANVCKEIFRSLTFKTNMRCDGRSFSHLRDISCQVDLFNPLHGSAMFQRGQTQVLCTVTLDSIESALRMDTLSMLTTGVKEKNFFLHYEFPPYATNEIGRVGFAGRRELGHGALAERGLRAVLPKNYPFTIRLTSEVLESNGSSSMASVCGGSLALMDAGVPISAPVAGVAIGLMTKYDKNGKQIEDYRLLTDILGMEDYIGDMDFKIAGTKQGVTSFQADIKIPGLPLKIIMEAINQASQARGKILDIMNNVIDKPREKQKDNMPVTEKIDIPIYMRGKFLGIGGSNMKKIFTETGVEIHSDDDNNHTLFAPNKAAMDEAKEMIQQILEQEREPDLEHRGIYTAKVVEIRDNGVMVQLYPKMRPALLHNKELSDRKIGHPSALGIEVGQELSVQYFGRDEVTGNIRLKRKALTQPISSVKSIMKNFFS